VTARYYGLYANARRGKIRKSEDGAPKLLIIEDEGWKIPRRGWAEIRRKVYEVDPLRCPQCGGTMKLIAFITDYQAVDRIINQLKLTFTARNRPRPGWLPRNFCLRLRPQPNIFHNFLFPRRRSLGGFRLFQVIPGPPIPSSDPSWGLDGPFGCDLLSFMMG
jgi:hypothetical protein